MPGANPGPPPVLKGSENVTSVIPTLEMERTEWLEQRRKGIGGSDAPVIMGVNPWRSPMDLWLEKTGEYIEDTLGVQP